MAKKTENRPLSFLSFSDYAKQMTSGLPGGFTLEIINQEKAIVYLNNLVDQPLIDAGKFLDTELYLFEFGEQIKKINRNGEQIIVGTLRLHILCRFKIIHRKGKGKAKLNRTKVNTYYEDTPAEDFSLGIQDLIGMKITRVGLSDKNDLCLDFNDGEYWVVFATFENGEESWRFFIADTEKPHLVASDLWLEFN